MSGKGRQVTRPRMVAIDSVRRNPGSLIHISCGSVEHGSRKAGSTLLTGGLFPSLLSP